MAHLEKKYDPTLTTYFEAFYKMCQRVTQKEKKDGDPVIVDRIEKSSMNARYICLSCCLAVYIYV